MTNKNFEECMTEIYTLLNEYSPTLEDMNIILLHMNAHTKRTSDTTTLKFEDGYVLYDLKS